MGSPVNRGTRSGPRWYVKYKDRDGRWKMRLSHLPTREHARKYLAQVEARVAQGKLGIQQEDATPLMGVLMDRWLETRQPSSTPSS